VVVCAASLTFAAAASAASVQVTVHANHAPKVNKPWPVTVTVSQSGKPIAATLTMQILFSGTPVGKIDNGRVYHFIGAWQEKAGNQITFPVASRGEPLTVQFIVKAAGQTIRKNWPIQVQ
jgi:hypothetical protein